MRAAFLLLVLANLVFFAWSAYFAPQGAGEGERLRTQIEPERIRLLPASALAEPAPGPAAADAAAPAACIEWGSFTLADLPAAEKSLEPLEFGARLAERRVEETASWWVYLPPQGSRAGAQNRTTELKALGIDDFFVVAEEGKWRWAVSLGVFRNEEGARSRLEALKAKGLRAALIGERELQVPKAWVQARGATAEELARWREIARTAFPAAEFRDCAP